MFEQKKTKAKIIGTFTVVGIVILLLGACGGEPPKHPKQPVSNAEQLYNKFCIACHGKDGKLGFSDATDLSTSTLSRAEAIEQIAEGKGTMVGYKRMLSKEDIEALAVYVEGFR